MTIGLGVVNPVHAPPGAGGHGDGGARRPRARPRRRSGWEQQPPLDRRADGDPVQDAAARPARGRGDRAPAARGRAGDLRRRVLLGRRRRARDAAARARAHPARRERPAGARAGRRGRRRRALLDPRPRRPTCAACAGHRRAPAAGTSRSSRTSRWRWTTTARRRARACARCSRAISARSTASPSWPTPASAPRATQPFRDALLRRARSPAELVTDEMIDALAVAGTPAECRRALARLAEAGLDTPVAVLPAGRAATPEQVARGIGRDAGAGAWKEVTIARMKFGVHIPTCIEGMMYPVPFARPEDILPTAQLAERVGFRLRVGQRPHDHPALRAARVARRRRTSTSR